MILTILSLVVAAFLVVAAATFVIGWIVVIADAVSGERLIPKIPESISERFEKIHNYSWVGVVATLAIVFAWDLVVSIAAKIVDLAAS